MRISYRQWTMLVSVSLFVVVLVRGVEGQTPQSVKERIMQAKQALEYVERIASFPGNCSGGTASVLKLAFDTASWVTYTDAAIRTANYFSQVLAMNGNKLDRLEDQVFYDFVRNNVHGDTLIFGSAIAIESNVHDRYITFCPYASKNKLGGVNISDLAKAYNYATPGTEWYYEVFVQNFSSVPVVTDTFDSGSVPTFLRQPVARYEHGRWTFPYFDCGGGDIWMVTYSAPILAISLGGTSVFEGVATIDLELTNVDINQCDEEEGMDAGSLDVFRGTHNCQPTTKCVHVAQQGFTRGSYLCYCSDGFYFPVNKADIPAFNGSDIDSFFDTYTSVTPDTITDK